MDFWFLTIIQLKNKQTNGTLKERMDGMYKTLRMRELAHQLPWVTLELAFWPGFISEYTASLPFKCPTAFSCYGLLQKVTSKEMERPLLHHCLVLLSVFTVYDLQPHCSEKQRVGEWRGVVRCTCRECSSSLACITIM